MLSSLRAFPTSTGQLKMDLNLRCSLGAQCLPSQIIDDTLGDCSVLAENYAKAWRLHRF